MGGEDRERGFILLRITTVSSDIWHDCCGSGGGNRGGSCNGRVCGALGKGEGEEGKESEDLVTHFEGRLWL